MTRPIFGNLLLLCLKLSFVRIRMYLHQWFHSSRIRILRILTRSSAVAERPRDASCFSVVSFNIPTARFLLPVTAASDLLVHKILLWLGYPIVKIFRRYLYSLRPPTRNKPQLIVSTPLWFLHSI